MGKKESTEVLIIGAGVAGLAAAGKLKSEGIETIILDKSRGVSGRVSTRRWAGHRVDHGAQFFTVRTPAFAKLTDGWLEDGTCIRWTKGFHQWTDGELLEPASDDGFPRYACPNGMSAIGKKLAEGLDVRTECQVTKLAQVDGKWEATTADGDSFVGNRLVVACPAPQAAALLDKELAEQEPGFLSELHFIGYSPTLCAMLRVKGSLPEWKGIQSDDPVLSWISADSSKRGGDSDEQVYVLHASGGFSEEWLEKDLEEAGRRMVQSAANMVGGWIAKHEEMRVHRWRYAHVEKGFSETPFLASIHEPDVYVIGDAFLGARVEGAYNSGISAAQKILSKSVAAV